MARQMLTDEHWSKLRTIMREHGIYDKPKLRKTVEWIEREKGYKTSSFYSNYGGVNQRWLLVYSEQAYKREKKTFEKKLEKQEINLEKQLWHISNELFSCETDAIKALSRIMKKFPYHRVEHELLAKIKYGKAGFPKKGVEGETKGYQIKSRFYRDKGIVDRFLNRKGRFILATNDLDEAVFPDEKILSEYKEQQKVERGFRFLKDPWFMVDSIFLKSPKRIEALMMVMTLCLMVYNVGQFRLRSALKEQKETLPNQINQPIQNPTLRWIFQIMEGIGIVRFYGKKIRDPIREMITNLNELPIKIIRLFGITAQKLYGIP